VRKTRVKRKTKETSIAVTLNIDGSGNCRVKTGIGFFDHMMESVAKHGLFNIEVKAKGDLHVDQHHTIEDTGLCLGQAFDQALGARKGIERAGCFLFPMDEALAYCAIDLSGRPFINMRCAFKSKKIGDLECACLEDFFQGFASALKASLHIKVVAGRSDHHKVEAMFKAFAKALKQACARTTRAQVKIPSTKGKL
jgi:imidazoleglycerol phosphate dehydratase HisB